MNSGIPATDGRELEVLAQGLPCRAGMQLAVDVTLRSAVSADGQPRPRAAGTDGAVAESARRDKEDKYPELLCSQRCALVVVAVETGGRWSHEAADFVEELAFARARDAPARLRHAAALAWQRRWVRLLSTACAVSFAHSLTAPCGDLGSAGLDGDAPQLCELLSMV